MAESKRLNVLPSHPEEGVGRFPSWLHRKLPKGGVLQKTGEVLSEFGLNTVCEEARCPNRLECWSKKTATFLVMGKECTRNCGFCDIDFSKNPSPLQADEPLRIALSIKKLGLQHVVITMVARDDLKDGGSAHLVEIMKKIRECNPSSSIEVLTSDFQGNSEALQGVLKEGPEIFNHNIETVRRLTPRVRHQAAYERTLAVLQQAADERYNPAMRVKSGLMVGLGESEEEVFETLRDLKQAGCDIVTIGQYLQPSRRKLLVKDFIHPEKFKAYEEYGLSIGLSSMYCGPFIRSSYNAAEIMRK